jgi:hypothetical protein
MTVRHAIFTALAALHLILVACGAAGWSVLSPKTFFGHALRVVRNYTGSDASYGFFAPGVSSTIRPTFTMIDAKGKQWTDTLDAEMSREAQLRVGSGLGLTGAFPNLVPAFAQSWSATMFGRHPTAQTVIVKIELYDMPPIEAYREGHRPQWVQVFPGPDDPPEIAVFTRIDQK